MLLNTSLLGEICFIWHFSALIAAISNMKPLKPLFMKTYGKQIRKVSAWISPENRKQAFDSTRSTDGDTSVFEPSKPTKIRKRKTSVSSHRATRPAKKKAMLCLIEKSFNEDNIPSPTCPQPAQHNRMTREKKTSGSRSGAVHPSKRKAMTCLTETSSDEENISRSSPPQQKKTTRKSRLVPVSGVLMRRRGQKFSSTSEREDSTSSTKCQKNSVQMKTDSTVHLPSAGRFVTRRRRAVAAKPKLPKATLSILNSSDDFTSGASGSCRIVWPSKRRRHPPAFVVSSAENSVNAAGTASFAANPSQEISLNELADHSLEPCPRKPIFCSTPSAGPFSKRPYLKPLPMNDQSTPPSMSLSCIGVLSTFQEDLDSSGQPVFTPRSAPPIELHSEEKPQSSFGEASADLFMEAKSSSKRSSCSEEAKSHREDIKTKKAGGLPSLNLISTDDSECSSHFVSAAGGLEWLVQALKEKCLTEHCTVQLERLYGFTVTQLCSQTPYSSCLEHSSSDHSQQTNEHPLSVHSIQTTDISRFSDPSFNLNLSVTNNKTNSYLQSINSESCEPAASVTDSQCTNSVVDSKHSAEHSSSKEPMERSALALHVQSTHHTDSSIEFIMGAQLPGNSPLQALFTEEEAVAVKEKCLTQKCTVQLQKMALSQMTVQQLKRSLQQEEEGLYCGEKSDLPDAKRSESNHTHNTDDPEDHTHSVEITTMASVQQPVNNSSSAAEVQYDDPEMEKRAAGLTAMLKEKCLTDQITIKTKRLTLSQLKEFLQLRDRKLKSHASMSDDDQFESGTNHSNAAKKVIMKKRGATRSEDKIASDKEVVNNNSCVPHKRKKTSLAPKEKKRRSTSMERSGTSRKACVSGLSVSRWKNKDGASTHLFRSRTAQTGGNRTVDCSINEFISTQHKQPRELLGTTMNFSTPGRVSRLNISSLLADVTPNTHTWSRLKAALSVHRKVLCTPGRSSPWESGSPRRAELVDVSQDLFATPFRSLLPKGLRSQLLNSSSQVECEDADLSDAEKVYAECGQQRPLPWEECIPPQRMKHCVKIGEGTFGEVFSTTNASGETVALKIIPVEGSEKVNGEDQKTFGEILHEIIISKELSSLKEKQQNQTHGFIGLKDLHCVQGCYPADFLNAWDAFDQQKSSENDRPDCFQKDQLFIILEFEFGGIDLENSNGTLMSLGVAKSILHQVTAALAVAEQELHFEHRDLHWGNVLVKPTKEKRGSFLLNGTAHSLETKGVLVRIIDYSLSRLEIDDLTVSCDISKDEELFMGQGDYQFDIYRLMRQENGNNWSNYHPHTNVLWLHYLCSKLLSMKYRGSGGRGAKDMREALTRFYDNVLQYRSASEALQNCPMFQ
uniref:uncharacterized protein haspin isoform X2 n=1 Tax=Scatophagus argus TaxID=75038 RepID=UPI001ED7FE10|nr:uncharacterized protein haspin isoform X2 [Scatophagus argus]